MPEGVRTPLLPGSHGLDVDSQELAEDRLADASSRGFP